MFQSEWWSHAGDDEGAHTPGGEQEGGEDEHRFTCRSAMNDATCGMSESKHVAIGKTMGWLKEANIDCSPNAKAESMCDIATRVSADGADKRSSRRSATLGGEGGLATGCGAPSAGRRGIRCLARPAREFSLSIVCRSSAVSAGPAAATASRRR
eukprot:3118393-Pyramimonas_sp.AAC.2